MYDSLPMGVEVALYLPIRKKAVQYTIFFKKRQMFSGKHRKKRTFCFFATIESSLHRGDARVRP